MAAPIQLPDSTAENVRQIHSRIQDLKEEIQQLDRQVQAYVQGFADGRGDLDLSDYRLDAEAGELVPTKDGE